MAPEDRERDPAAPRDAVGIDAPFPAVYNGHVRAYEWLRGKGAGIISGILFVGFIGLKAFAGFSVASVFAASVAIVLRGALTTATCV